MGDALVELGGPSDAFAEDLSRRQQQILEAMDAVRVSVLIWGPSPTSGDQMSSVRTELRDTLRRGGHLANFSEELIDPDSSRSVVAQQHAHVEAHDITFSLPSTPGSIAEIHDFARLGKTSQKIVAFLDSRWNDGYSNQSLVQLQSIQTASFHTYDHQDLPGCVVTEALGMVYRLQELFYMWGRRV